VLTAGVGVAEAEAVGGFVSTAGSAIRNDAAVRVRPRMAREDVTVTVSPLMKGRSGMKLVPAWSGWTRSRPVCVPLREPATVSVSTAAAALPRRLIDVAGDAVWLPGDGNMLTVPGAFRSRLFSGGAGAGGWAVLTLHELNANPPATPPASRPNLRRVSEG
jgi:hypothetical protein